MGIFANLFSYRNRRILILYENIHYIIPFEKNCFFLNIFLSAITFSFYFILQVEVMFFFNGTLFAQEIPKQLIPLFMDYDVALRLENVESQK